MCGIIGISSHKSVSVNIISSLKKLEYRGYDSAGLATLFNGEINEVIILAETDLWLEMPIIPHMVYFDFLL